jgi:hypothetical protein
VATVFVASAAKYNVKVCDLIAIASRESNMEQKIGDNQNGYSVMQIDRRSFPIFVASGKWRDPAQAIDMGAKVLDSKRTELRRAGIADETLLCKAMISAYNAGAQGALRGIREHNNSDAHTTGGEYAADVLQRSFIIADLLTVADAPTAQPQATDAPALLTSTGVWKRNERQRRAAHR